MIFVNVCTARFLRAELRKVANEKYKRTGITETNQSKFNSLAKTKLIGARNGAVMEKFRQDFSLKKLPRCKTILSLILYSYKIYIHLLF